MSSGDGRNLTTASSRGWTPLFLNAVPHRTGLSLSASVARRIAASSSSTVKFSSPSSRYFSMIVVVGLGERLDELLAVLRGLLGELGRDLLDLVVLTHRGLAAPGEGTHADQVDDTEEVGLGTDRELEHERGGVEALDHHVDAAEEVRSGAVELVDEAHAGDGVLVGLAPHRHGLRLDTGDTVEHRHGAVEDAQRALDLGGEVHVAGRVDDVDLVVLPPAGRRGGRDGDAALLLLLHPVHRGATLVDLTDLVGDAGVEEDALGGGGLAGVDVRHDADVADLVEVGGDVDSHCCVSVPRKLVGARGVRGRTTRGAGRTAPRRHQR